MDNNINNLEEEFLKDTTENGRFILCIGSKASGKSHLLCSYLKYVLFNKLFESILFVCPVWAAEQNNSYDFLRNQKQVKIFNRYTENVARYVDKERRKHKTLFLIDDGSGFLNKTDETLQQLVSTTRHFKGLTMYINVHSAKSILKPFIRINSDYFFLFKTTNAMLIKDIYEEFFSMSFNNFNEFKTFYMSCMSEKYNALLFTIHSKYLDNNVKYWNIIQNKDIYDLKPVKKEQKPVIKEKQPLNHKPFILSNVIKNGIRK